MTVRRAVVVGASIAGVTAAESLRDMGFDGEIVLVEAEPGNPYQRPPLSKTILAGASVASVEIATAGSLADRGIRFLPGVRVERIDREAQTIDLNGEPLAYTDLVIATGAAPIVPFASSSERLTTLRTRADAASMAAALQSGVRVVVIGGGVLGSEIASAARLRSCEVVLISDLPELRLGPVQGRLSDHLVAAHRAAGVDVRLGRSVCDVRDVADEAVVTMAGGEVVIADLVVVAAGVQPSVGWVQGVVEIGARGIRCSGPGRAGDRVWAIGDAAHWIDEPVGYPGTQSAAIDQARIVAADVAGAPLPLPLTPYFWADVHGTRVQAVGELSAGSEGEVVAAATGPGFCVTYVRDSEVVGAIAWAAPREFLQIRRSLRDLVRQEMAS